MRKIQSETLRLALAAENITGEVVFQDMRIGEMNREWLPPDER